MRDIYQHVKNVMIVECDHPGCPTVKVVVRDINNNPESVQQLRRSMTQMLHDGWKVSRDRLLCPLHTR